MTALRQRMLEDMRVRNLLPQTSTIPSFLMKINHPLSILPETGCCSLIIF
jgi:hypothetical protein